MPRLPLEQGSNWTCPWPCHAERLQPPLHQINQSSGSLPSEWQHLSLQCSAKPHRNWRQLSQPGWRGRAGPAAEEKPEALPQLLDEVTYKTQLSHSHSADSQIMFHCCTILKQEGNNKGRLVGKRCFSTGTNAWPWLSLAWRRQPGGIALESVRVPGLEQPASLVSWASPISRYGGDHFLRVLWSPLALGLVG